MGRVRASRKGLVLGSLGPLAALVVAGGLFAGCAAASASPSREHSATGPKVVAVGAENEYANVISQVGGPYVSVAAIMSNPNTDPHEFEASAQVAVQVSEAQLIVQNGVGYDSFMDKIEACRTPIGSPGHRGAASPGPVELHLQSPPVVRPPHDAGGGPAPWRPTSRGSSLRTERFSRRTPGVSMSR